MLVYNGKYKDLVISKLDSKDECINILLAWLPYDLHTTYELWRVFMKCPKFIFSIYDYHTLKDNYYIKRVPIHIYDADLNRFYDTLEKYKDDYYFIDYLTYDNTKGIYSICLVELHMVKFNSDNLTILRKIKLNDILNYI